jgi:hypothetical protein
MLWDPHASELAQRMREQLRAASGVLWPWDVRVVRVRVCDSNIKVHLDFVADIQLGAIPAGRCASVSIVVRPVRWRPIHAAGLTTERVRALLCECVSMMLLGIKREAQRGGHAALVAQLEARSGEAVIRWSDEQSSGEAA